MEKSVVTMKPVKYRGIVSRFMKRKRQKFMQTFSFGMRNILTADKAKGLWTSVDFKLKIIHD